MNNNFALTYTSAADVTLAPVYDVATVVAYPDYQNDLPALTLSGKKVWRSGRLLHQYGAVRLTLTTSQMSVCVDEVDTAIAETAPLVRRHADAYPAFGEVGKRMLTAWAAGRLDIMPTVTAKARAGDRLRASVGLSDQKRKPKAKKKNKNPYGSPDDAMSHKIR